LSDTRQTSARSRLEGTIGRNLSHESAAFAPTVASAATSIATATGRSGDLTLSRAAPEGQSRRQAGRIRSAAKGASIVRLIRAHVFIDELHETLALTVIERLMERLGRVGDLLQGG
jgi:hypothetical protein